jgi:hypothetical protein
VAGVVGFNTLVARGFNSISEAYRAKAVECFERAKRLHNHTEYRHLYRDLAIEWLALAAEAEYEERDAS